MDCTILSIHYCPVKSLSFENIKSCVVKKNKGILNDRIFAFSKDIEFKKAKIIEQNPNARKLSHFLTLKNSPALNKYNFIYDNEKLILTQENKDLVSIELNKPQQLFLFSDKLIELENSLKGPFYLINNIDFPFYDTTHSEKILNSISLINLNSISDFEKKIDKKIEFQRFRGNFYVDGINAWEERNWINKIIKINNISFKVEKNIPRCSATNLQPNTDNTTINLPLLLKKNYGHIDMGIYLTALDDGKIEIDNQIELNQ